MNQETEGHEALPRRFELIKKMYFSDKVTVQSKKDQMLNWFFIQFKGLKKEKSSLCYKLLWETFHDILVEEKKLNLEYRILIKSDSLKNFVEVVQHFPLSCSWAHVILSSISTFLKTPTVNATLIADINTLLNLVIGTLKITSEIYQQESRNQQSLKEAIHLSNCVLDILENLPSSDEDDKLAVLSKSLRDISIFMHLSISEKELDSLSERVTKKIISILFNLKTKQYETLMTPVTLPAESVPPNPHILHFLTSLQDILHTDDLVLSSVPANLACSSLMKRLFQTFLIQNKSNLHSLKVLALCFATCGLDIPIILGVKSSCRSLFKKKYDNGQISLLAISHLLEACCAVPQFFTTMAVPDGYIKPSLWLKGVSAALLDARDSGNKSTWLKCFQCLLTISPTIIENDILLLIKTGLLNLSVKSTESKKQYSELFSSILQVHSQLHQIPKFFVKFLLAVTECIKEESGGQFLQIGQLLPEVEECIGRCIHSLPPGQMIDLWKIFIETFSTLEIMSEVFSTNKCYIFLVAQLFSTFLFHAQLFQANIPSNNQSHFKGLIKKTSDEIQKNIPSLKETNPKSAPLKRSVLLLSYAIGEVKLAYNAYYDDKSIEDDPNISLSDQVFDLSITHSFLDKDFANTLESFMTGDDKILSALTFQLLLQKLKTLQFKQFLSEEKTHMQKMVSTVLHYLQSCQYAIAPWNTDLCLINTENYGSVLWNMFFKVLPLIMPNFSPRDFYSLCNSAYEILSTDGFSEHSAKSIILSSLKNDFFQESKHFQSAFVSIIWQQERLLSGKKRLHKDIETDETATEQIFSLLNTFHSKDFKYAQRNPKNNANLGNMWDKIKQISELLNSILSSESLPRDKLIADKIFAFTKLFNILPLEYLLPGNQMKCIIGLSFLFFRVPQSCSQSDALQLAKDISSILISIFDGARSIWLFDFVHSGPYLKHVVQTLELIIDDDCSDYNWAINLIDHLVSLIIRTTDSLNAVEPYISSFLNKDKVSRTSLITTCAFLKKFSQVLNHSHKQEIYKETLSRVSSMTCSSFLNYMKLNFSPSVEKISHSFFIKCYMYVIEIVCCPTFEPSKGLKKESLQFLSSTLLTEIEKQTSINDDVLFDVYLLFISKVCKHSSKISSHLSKDFEMNFWSFILTHLEKRAEINKKNSIYSKENLTDDSDISQLKSFCVCGCDQFHLDLKDHKQLISGLEILTFSESEKECLREFSFVLNIEKLTEILKHLLNKLGYGSSRIEVSTFNLFLMVFQCLISANSEKCHDPVLIEIIQQGLTFLHQVANQACESQVCQLLVLIPILDFMSFILQGNKGFSNQLLFQSLHCVVSVPVEVVNGNYEMYTKVFIAAWNVVYGLFMYHTGMVLNSPAPFLAYVSKLLKSVVKASSADQVSKCSSKTYQQMQLCAENMNRLLTVISRYKIEFSKLVPYLIADYVDTVQHITLESNMKESILSGLHRLLDLCSEESIKMLAVNVNFVSREIYGNLVKNYRQNKYSGAM